MTEAIFALVGVVVGALLTGTVQYTLERRREKRNARSAALILQLELWRGVEGLGRPEYKLAERFGDGLGPDRALSDLLGAVAGHLTGREWERLEEGWRVLNDYAAMPRFWEKHDRSIEDGRHVVAEGAAALNRLVGIKSGE